MASNQRARPGVGELARDQKTGRVGLVMGDIGGRVQKRPTNGGIEWDAMPDDVATPEARQRLSVRLAVENNNSRVGL
ncbi:hypothetical protein ACIQV2_12635 [Streptomyces globosus]|uniref:hypothetical protein n=1 Tax=Streptomyces globosus TaxID=68209 RepID=UPI00380C70CA